MEALAAVGLASSILQIVDFAAKLLSTGRQIHKAGSTVEHAELQAVVNDFNALNDQLKSWARPDPTALGPLERDSQSLENLALESEKIATELINILSTLRLDGQASKTESALHAVRAVWNKRKLEETKKRLGEIREELQLRILITMKGERLQGLDEATQKIVLSVLESKKDLADALTAQTNEFLQQQKDNETSASARHDRLVDLISNTREREIDFEYVSGMLRAELSFRQKDDRYDDIAEAHQRTFEWAIQSDTTDQAPWPSLVKWLRTDSGIYWISGKAGSGKSTLMKFLYQNPGLIEALEIWAGESELLVIRFYFWNAGTDFQKSQEGLFRSLLLQVLEQAPSLGPILFPEQYASGAKWSNFPTFHELRRAFIKLTSQLDSSHKVAMLIDGLDEFDSTRISMTELAEIFLTATKPANFKAMVSSRPLPAFEASFSMLPKLRLHQLTHSDIETYVHDHLGVHPRIIELSKDDPTGTAALLSEIVNSASGVFLWVRLVVRSLLEGLQNYDTLEDLNKRLSDLPRDLEDLFRHMLRKIPLEYKVQSSRIFQIHRYSYLSYSAYEEPPLTATALYFAEADTETILQANIAPLAEDDRHRREAEMEGRLRSRCVGLLELRPRRTQFTTEIDPDLEVVYLHKSVADFLELEDVWNEIVGPTGGSVFDPYTALLQSLVMRIKCAKLLIQLHLPQIWFLVSAAMHLARLAESSTKVAARGLLEELDKVMSSHFKAAGPWGKDISTWYDIYNKNTRFGTSFLSVPWHNNFLAFMVSNGLTLCVQSVIEGSQKDCIQKKGRPLLDYACRPFPEEGGRSESNYPDLVLLLLQHGADPNQKFNGFSPWQNALCSLTWSTIRWTAVLKLLVLYGADPNAYIEGRTMLSQNSWRKWRKSCFMFLKRRLDNVSEYSVPESKETEFKTKILEILQLLKEKGARDEEWHELNGVFQRVSPASIPPLPSPPHHITSRKAKLSKRMRQLLNKVK